MSIQKPFKAVSKDSIARWVKQVLMKAGINITTFGAHSTRSASTSAAKASGDPVNTIMKAAGWSSETTFARFYERAPAVNMGERLLEVFSRH